MQHETAKVLCPVRKIVHKTISVLLAIYGTIVRALSYLENGLIWALFTICMHGQHKTRIMHLYFHF